MSKEYPVEIYPKPNEPIKDSTERIYDRGYSDGLKAQRDLTGWSNLTEAIKAGERIDWERLNGLEAKCVHPELGVLTYKMERNIHFSMGSSSGWCVSDRPRVWGTALYNSWHGKGGWSLWVKGDLPLRKRTADELDPGTCVKGSHPEVCEGEAVLCVVIESVGPSKRVLYPGPTISRPASEVEVVEVYGVGTFETPEGDA